MGSRDKSVIRARRHLLLNKFPEDSFGIHHLAEALHRQGQRVDAISKLGVLLSNEDRRQAPTILYDLARYFAGAEQLKEAREFPRMGQRQPQKSQLFAAKAGPCIG
jgi:hypothetical protein